MVEKVQEKMKSILYFIIKMLLLSIPLYIILWTDWESIQYQNFITDQIRSILNLLGMSTLGTDNHFTLDGVSFLISWDCTGWKSLLFLSALMISTPSKLKDKVMGLTIGLYGLFTINIFRIVLLVNIAIVYGVGLFNFAHNILWQLFGSIAVLAIWLLWMNFSDIL